MYKYPGGFPLKIVVQPLATGNLRSIGYCRLIPPAVAGGIRLETTPNLSSPRASLLETQQKEKAERVKKEKEAAEARDKQK